MMRKRSSSEQQQDSQKRKVDHGIVTTRHCSCKALLARRMGSASEKYHCPRRYCGHHFVPGSPSLFCEDGSCEASL